jgi:HEAT repeat protein
MTGFFLALVAIAAPARQDAVPPLASALAKNDADPAAVKAALDGAIEAGAVKAVPPLLAAIDRLGEALSKSEVDAARTGRELEGLQKKEGGGDAAALEDKRASLAKTEQSTSSRRQVLDAVAAGLPKLLDAVAARRESASVPLLESTYEEESKRVEQLERDLEQQKGKLAQLSSRLFELEGDKAPSSDVDPVAANKVEEEARVARTELTLGLHRAARAKLAEATGALLQSAKGPEVDAALKQLEKRVDGKAPADERVRWIDLYARLGREGVPGELIGVALDATKALKKGEPELAKLREQYEKYKELLFKDSGDDGLVSVATKNAFEALQKQVIAAAAQAHALENLRGVASRAAGPAVASIPAEKRARATATLLASAKGEKDLETRCGLVDSLRALDEPAVREALRKLLVEDKDVKARLSALDALVALADAEAMEIVRARLLAHENWRVRSAAASALWKVPQKESIPVLIQALGIETGRVLEDVVQALQRLTGQSLAASGPVWAKWWSENEATFDLAKVPKERERVVAAWDRPAKGKVTFYGITSISKKICFVLDVSKSMDDPASDKSDRRKIDLAKEQLKQAIGGLADGDQLMIVTFAGTAKRWQPKLVTVNAQVKQKATEWVDEKLELGPGTNIHDGMKEALTVAGMGARDAAYEAAIDTIFFLSDGDATVGEVIDPLELRRLIREWNRLARIRIHTIGVGKEPNIALLYGIAEDSGGQFQKR